MNSEGLACSETVAILEERSRPLLLEWTDVQTSLYYWRPGWCGGSKCGALACQMRDLSRTEFDEFDAAIPHTFAREPAPLFSRPDEPSANRDAHASQVCHFLFEIADRSNKTRKKLLAAKWLPYFASSLDECMALLERLLHHHNPDLRAMAALQISFINKEYPRITHHLWNPIEHANWSGKEIVSVNGMNGSLQKVVLKRLTVLASGNGDLEQMQETSNQCARFWFNQMAEVTPVDRDAFVETMRAFYRFLSMPEPAVLFFDSPRTAAVAASIFMRCTKPKYRYSSETSISKPDAYVRKFVRIMDRFPRITPDFRESWAFAERAWVPQSEYDDEQLEVPCATMRLRKLLARGRDLWDVAIDYNHGIENEVDRAREALADHTDIGSFERDMDLSKNIYWFMDKILNHERLGMVGYRSVLKQIGACPHSFDSLEQLLQICPTFIAFDDHVIACERPISITRDNEGRLHNLKGPSVEYADGWGVYSAQGMTVPPNIISKPDTITVEQIISHENLEIRRFMLEQYGIERFITDSGAVLIDESAYGALYEMPVKRDRFNMVRVRNSTTEPDGTLRVYFIAVPPTIQTAREAVAWTFEMKETEYHPTKQT